MGIEDDILAMGRNVFLEEVERDERRREGLMSERRMGIYVEI